MNKTLLIRKGFIILLLAGNITGIIMKLTDGWSVVESLSYFTVISNVFVTFVFVYLLFKRKELNACERNFKAAATVSILVTFIVYHVLLAALVGGLLNFWINLLLHTYTPVLVVLDYILFDPKGNFRLKNIFSWLMLPLLYFVYVNVYALLGGTYTFEDSTVRYPYFFLNPDKIGWGYVILFVLGISLFVLGLSAFYVWIDQKLGKRQKNHEIRPTHS